jgi:hypothetical protein
MDSDDIITPDCIETLYKAMTEYPVDFVAASRIRKSFNDDCELGRDIYADCLLGNGSFLSVAHDSYLKKHKILGPVWNKLYNLEFLRKYNIHCLPNVHVEDVSFTYQTILHATSCRLLSKCTYIYQVHENQSFIAFGNNRKRSLFLAENFVEVTEYDKEIIKSYQKNKMYGVLLLKIQNVALLMSTMLLKSTVLSKQEKKCYIKKLIGTFIPLKQLLHIRSKILLNYTYWIFANCPWLLQKIILKLYCHYKPLILLFIKCTISKIIRK